MVNRVDHLAETMKPSKTTHSGVNDQTTTSDSATKTTTAATTTTTNPSKTILPKHFRVLALYEFVTIPKSDLKALQNELEQLCRPHDAKGTLIISTEGINGTICYPYNHDHYDAGDDENSSNRQTADLILRSLQSRFSNLRIRLSKVDSKNIFYRFKVKIKAEIVTMGLSDRNGSDDGGGSARNDGCTSQQTAALEIPPPFDGQHRGEYVKPGPEWDALLKDPECLVIDTRNTYEYRIGTFTNAVNPQTQSFTEFPNYLRTKLMPRKDPNDNNDGVDENKKAASSPPNFKKLAMFCTGGIRCEKSTALARSWFPDTPVYHLEGGVLAYLASVPPSQSQFRGECYVFDQRIAVTHGLQPTQNYQPCYACRQPLSYEERRHPHFQKGVSCQYCKDKTTERQKERYQQRAKQIQLSEEQRACRNSKGMRSHLYDPKSESLQT